MSESTENLLKATAEAIAPYLPVVKAEVDPEEYVTCYALAERMGVAIENDPDIVMDMVRNEEYVDVYSMGDVINDQLSGSGYLTEDDFTDQLVNAIENDDDVQGEIKQIVVTQIAEDVEPVVKELVETQLNKHEIVFQTGFSDLVMEDDNIDSWLRRIVQEIVQEHVLSTVNSAVRASNRNLAAIYQQLANEVGSIG